MKKYIYFRLPELMLKKRYKRNLVFNYNYYVKETIKRYLWNECYNDNENLDPIHIDTFIKELEEFRDNTYRQLYERFMNRRIIDEEMGSHYGIVEDIGLESNSMYGVGHNVYVDFGGMSASYMFKREETHYEELREEKDRIEREMLEKDYPDNLKKGTDKINEMKNIIPNINMSEDELEKYLYLNGDKIEPGLSCFKNQYDVDGGIIDLVALDKDDKVCIIELKVNTDDPRLVYQCMYYPTQFDEDVRMITIAPGYNTRIKKCLDQLGYVEMKIYRFDNDGNVIIEDYEE